MATRNETHVHDLSTLANFKDWAQAISNAFSAFGWTQSSDTGQVNWTSIASVPTSGNYVYEIWKPGDALTTFYVRIDYGNSGGSSPAIKVQCGTTTNGAGTLTGFTTTQAVFSVGSNSGSTLYNCLFSGNSGRFSAIMWREASSGLSVVFNIERSKDSSGADTSSHVTLYAIPIVLNSASSLQQSIVFGVGAAPVLAPASTKVFCTPWLTAYSQTAGSVSGVFNGNTPIAPVFPLVGYVDNPCLGLAIISLTDLSEAAVITTTIYGATHTYVGTKFSQGLCTGPQNQFGTLMLWE